MVLSITSVWAWDKTEVALVVLVMTVPSLLLISLDLIRALKGRRPLLGRQPLLVGVWIMVCAALLWSTSLWFAAPVLAALATSVLAYSWVRPTDREQFWVGSVGISLGVAIVWGVASIFAWPPSPWPIILVVVLVAALEVLRRRAAHART